MGTDFSRVRLDALLDYAGVELKQGAVLLDGDANEAMDILDRRLRALGGDLLGRVLVSATTPDAFEIKASGGTLTIGVGRLYVDGLLVQCHGGDRKVAADRAFDALMAESTYKNPLPYADQPYLHALAPPVLPTTGRHLVYLDAWNREVTHLEQPDLIEIAVGVETSSRIQTVWQVKVLDQETGNDATCASPDKDLPGWASIIAPSTGVLTTGTDPVAPVDDPCELPPTGGYRGLENQLYRVEIHNPTGTAGGPTFKWSRDNASVGSRVVDIVSSSAANGTVLELETLGRDDVLSFKSNDWVEITDDSREFASRPGEMRKIAVDAEHRRITFKPELPADLQPALPAERNLRVRRWDQKGTSGAIAIPSPPATLTLEHGVTVRLEPGTNGFRTGDHWVFAARTADASVEQLDAAPPRGIHHHYARLAIWDADAGTVTDCRPKRPVEGCCTIVVKPGESIQAAIDALPNVGGCVCLRAGLHPVSVPISIVRDNVTLHGESLGAIVANPQGSGVLDIEGAEHVRVHTIVFRQIEAGVAPAIRVRGAEDLVVDDCRIEAPGRVDSAGMRIDRSADVAISGCAFLGQALGVWLDAGCRDVTVSGCEFMLAREIGRIPANAAILARNMSGPVTLEENTIDGIGDGIIVDDDPNGRPFSRADGSRIWGNRLRLHGEADLSGQTEYGIDVAARDSSVGDNRIEHDGGRITAIRLCGSGSSASGNVIVSRGSKRDPSMAIAVGHFITATENVPIERIVVTDNIIEGTQNGISLVGAARSRVAGNLLGGATTRNDFGIALYDSPDCWVSENEAGQAKYGVYCEVCERTVISGNRLDRGELGIKILNDRALTISGNRLTDFDQGGISISGATERCNLIENRILRCGGETTEIAFAISATDIGGELHVESNEIMDTGGTKAALAYGIIGENILEARIESNLVTYAGVARNPLGEDRALRLRGFFDVQVSDNITFGFAVQITNNKFIGTGASALVELWEFAIGATFALRFERVLFHGNYCWHFSQPRPAVSIDPTGLPFVTVATVSLVGRHCSVTGNHVKATTQGFPSYNLHAMPGPFIGNVSHVGHSNRAAQMPNPEAAFNTNA